MFKKTTLRDETIKNRGNRIPRWGNNELEKKGRQRKLAITCVMFSQYYAYSDSGGSEFQLVLKG